MSRRATPPKKKSSKRQLSKKPVQTKNRLHWLDQLKPYSAYALVSLSLVALLTAALWWSLQQNKQRCLRHFNHKNPPTAWAEHKDDWLLESNQALCYQGYAMQYLPTAATPLWIAEHFQPSANYSKYPVPSYDFYWDSRVIGWRAPQRLTKENSDIKTKPLISLSSGSDLQSQYDRFAQPNLARLSSNMYQQLWLPLNYLVRELSKQNEMYVISGVFGRDKALPNAERQWVYKAIYLPKQGIASAYLFANQAKLEAKTISICALEEQLRADVFPELDEAIKRQHYHLPIRAQQLKTASIEQWKSEWDGQSQCSQRADATRLKRQQKQFMQALPQHFE